MLANALMEKLPFTARRHAGYENAFRGHVWQSLVVMSLYHFPVNHQAAGDVQGKAQYGIGCQKRLG